MSTVFDPNEIDRIVRNNQAGTVEENIEGVVRDLKAAYPKYVSTRNEWVMSVAGGCRGHFRIVHASITEYILIFGTPIGTDGFTGRFPADDWFWMLSGEQWVYDEGQLDKTVYKPGSPVHLLPRGTGRFFKFTEGSYGVEYVRGWVPLMMPFGLADAMTSTLDGSSIVKTIKAYGRATIENLLVGKI
jgi:C-8 sterol isomerase